MKLRLIILSLFMSSAAFADDDMGLCVPVSQPKKHVEEKGGKWITLSHDQLEFLRGIYAMNPLTPPGLPFGESVVMATIPENENGMIFFIDGERACTPMSAPKTLQDLLDKILTNEINHEGDKS